MIRHGSSSKRLPAFELTPEDRRLPVLDLNDLIPDWIGDAACPEVDPEMFFPEKGEYPRDARRICKVCPVTDECLAWALENDERFGVWGGTLPRERDRIRRGLPLEPERPNLCRNDLHEMTPDNIYYDGSGRGTCLACRRTTKRRYEDKRNGKKET